MKNGSKQSDEAKAKMAAKKLGVKRKPLSDATKAKIAAAKTGVKRGPFSAKHLLNMSLSRQGKEKTDSHKKALSESCKAAWEKRNGN